ncbi:UNVERIFIED_CONTAM: hypothetical protein RMT77_014753 [Armadillidium vulgare]
MMSSLENLCRIPTVVVISNHPDIKEQIFTYSLKSLNSPTEYDDWSGALQSELSTLLNGHSIPEGIPWDSLPFIGIEMLKWAEYLHANFDMPIKFTKDFIKSSYFTSRGLLDEEKAARELINEPSLRVFLQYKIACYYFFQDIAKRLWRKFHKESEFKQIFMKYHSEDPLVLWTKYFKKTENSSLSEPELDRISRDFINNIFNYGMFSRNLSAIKFVALSGSRGILDGIEGNYWIELLAYEMNQIPNISENHLPSKLLLSRNFSSLRDIMINLLNLVKRENRESFSLDSFKVYYNLLKSFLVWPYQDFFMKTAISVFNILTDCEFYQLMHDFLNVIADPNLNRTYNYRHLLREFWIKSPTKHKKYFMHIEAAEPEKHSLTFIDGNLDLSPSFVLQKIIMLNNFSNEDEKNFQLILQSATLEEKENIINVQGEKCLSELLSKNKLKLVDMYLNTLCINNNHKKEIKRRQAASFFRDVVLEKWSLEMADRYVNWAVSPEEVSNFKHEIFPETFKFSDVANAYLLSEISVSCLTKFLEWYGKTDEEILNWKNNGQFDHSISTYFFRPCGKFCIRRFCEFFKWLGYSEQKLVEKKIEILASTSSAVLFSFFLNKGYAKKFLKKLIYLCSNNKELVKKKFKFWEYYFLKDFVKKDYCQIYFIDKESRFELLSHLYYRNIDSENVKEFNFNLNELNFLIYEHDNETF